MSEFSPSDIPQSELENAMQYPWHYTVGFLRLGIRGKQETADLLGSGVLVKKKDQSAILTAQHVLKIFPKIGRLGLVLSENPETSNINVNGVEHVEIGRGEIDSDGPDIGFIRLSNTTASTIGARKSFYN